MPHDMNDDSMKKPSEPSAASLEKMPEISEPRFRRRPGRGHHTGRSVGEIVAIDAELWAHLGSADAEDLRALESRPAASWLRRVG